MYKFICAVRKMRNNPDKKCAIIWCPLLRIYFTISEERFTKSYNNIPSNPDYDDNFISFDESGDELVYTNFDLKVI